jgi:hypothetical protein
MPVIGCQTKMPVNRNPHAYPISVQAEGQRQLVCPIAAAPTEACRAISRYARQGSRRTRGKRSNQSAQGIHVPARQTRIAGVVHGPWQHEYTPGLHTLPDGGHVLATETALTFTDAAGRIAGTKPNGRPTIYLTSRPLPRLLAGGEETLEIRGKNWLRSAYTTTANCNVFNYATATM